MDLRDEVIMVTTGGQQPGRVGQPGDIAQSAAFLFENDHITNRVTGADSGIRLQTDQGS